MITMQERGEAVPCDFSHKRVALKPTVALHEAGGLLEFKSNLSWTIL